MASRRKRKFGVEPPKKKPKGGIPSEVFDPFQGWDDVAAGGPLQLIEARRRALRDAIAESVINAFQAPPPSAVGQMGGLSGPSGGASSQQDAGGQQGSRSDGWSETLTSVARDATAKWQNPIGDEYADGTRGGFANGSGLPWLNILGAGGLQGPLGAAIMQNATQQVMQGGGLQGPSAEQPLRQEQVPQQAARQWQNPRVPIGSDIAVNPNATTLGPQVWSPQEMADATTIDPMRLLSALFSGVAPGGVASGSANGFAPTGSGAKPPADGGFAPTGSGAKPPADGGFVPSRGDAKPVASGGSTAGPSERQRLASQAMQAIMGAQQQAPSGAATAAPRGPLPAANQSGYLGGGPAEGGLLGISPTYAATGFPLGPDVGGNTAIQAQNMVMDPNTQKPNLAPMIQQLMASFPAHLEALANGTAGPNGMLGGGEVPGGGTAGPAPDAEIRARRAAAARMAALRQAFLSQMGALGTSISGAQAEGGAAADRALAAIQALGSPYQTIQLGRLQEQNNPLADYMQGLGTGTKQVDATMGLINSMNQEQNAATGRMESNLQTMSENARNSQLADITLSREAFIQNLAKQKAEQELALKNYYSQRGVRV